MYRETEWLTVTALGSAAAVGVIGLGDAGLGDASIDTGAGTGTGAPPDTAMP